MRYCSNCGNQLGDNAQFCQNCGAAIDKAENQPMDEKESESNNINTDSVKKFISDKQQILKDRYSVAKEKVTSEYIPKAKERLETDYIPAARENAAKLKENISDIKAKTDKRFSQKQKLIAAVTILVLAILSVFSIAAGSIFNFKYNHILSENGYPKDATVVKAINLKDNVKGLDNSKFNKLILVYASNRGKYDSKGGISNIAVMNTKDKTVKSVVFRFVPLNATMMELDFVTKKDNIKNLAIIKDFIEKYGFDCMSNQNYAEEYMRKVTGKDGIIPTSKAKDAIQNSITTLFPKAKSNNDVTVLYEKDCAVPRYYTTQITEKTYRWDSIIPEEAFEDWKASLDKTTYNFMVKDYGEPYFLKTYWVVYDHTFNKRGTCSSLDDVKKKYDK